MPAGPRAPGWARTPPPPDALAAVTATVLSATPAAAAAHTRARNRFITCITKPLPSVGRILPGWAGDRGSGVQQYPAPGEALHRTWDNPPLIGSESTADHQMVPPHPPAASHPMAVATTDI